MSKYEMTGFGGNKFYFNCALIPGFFIEIFNLYRIFIMLLSEMTLSLLSLSILVFMTVDFLIDYNMYKRFSKNNKKRIYITEGQEINLV